MLLSKYIFVRDEHNVQISNFDINNTKNNKTNIMLLSKKAAITTKLAITEKQLAKNKKVANNNNMLLNMPKSCVNADTQDSIENAIRAASAAKTGERENVHLVSQQKPTIFRTYHSANGEKLTKKISKKSFVFPELIEPRTQPISIMTKRINFRRRADMANSHLIIIWLEVFSQLFIY